MKTNLLIALCLNFTLKAQTTYIPDDNFEQYLINIGLDSAPLDDYVSTASIDTVTALNLSSVNDITGVEDFTELKDFTIDFTSLTSIDMSNNLKLKMLVCQNGYVTSINISNNPQLEHLDFNNNNLSLLDVTNNPRLKYLSFNSNNVTSIDFTQNDSLIFIDCQWNPFTTIDLTQNLQLEILGIANYVNAIDLSQNIELRRIFGRIYLPTIDLSNNSKLEFVYLPCGELEIVDVSNNHLLTYINVSCNQLIFLNMQNGNNNQILDSDFHANSNPNLTCILVDDDYYSSVNWFNIDIQSFFSLSCLLENEHNDAVMMESYPNPVIDVVTIVVDKNMKYSLVTIAGKEIMSGEFYSGKNYLDLDEIDSGLYLINLKFGNSIESFKILK